MGVLSLEDGINLRVRSRWCNFFEKIFHSMQIMLFLNPNSHLRFFSADRGSRHGTETARAAEGVS